MEYGEHQVRDASTRAPSRCGTDYASFASAGSFDSFPWNEEELKQVKSHDVKVLEAFRYKIQKRDSNVNNRRVIQPIMNTELGEEEMKPWWAHYDT